MSNLYLVATPIGNLEDITYRAVRILGEVDVIAAEDTRRTRELLNRYQIRTPMLSYHRHNQAAKTPYLLGVLQEGREVALVSDAGMPGISDPGEELVKNAINAGINIVPVPGASALITALVVSGLPAGRFAFEGFLPRTGKKRREKLSDLAVEERTMILYEAPHRLVDALKDMAEIMGNRKVTVAREVTKKFESFWRGTLPEAAQFFSDTTPKGEFTLVIAGAQPETLPLYNPQQAALEVAALRSGGMGRKEAMIKTAKKYGVTRRDIYQACLQGSKE